RFASIPCCLWWKTTPSLTRRDTRLEPLEQQPGPVTPARPSPAEESINSSRLTVRYSFRPASRARGARVVRQGRKDTAAYGVSGMGGNGPSALGRRTGTVALCWGFALVLTVGGCSFGPRVLERSYGPYYESVRHVDEEELLRNLVHIRYHETPGSLS